MKDIYVDGEKMARNGCKIAKRKSCDLFCLSVFTCRRGSKYVWEPLYEVIASYEVTGLVGIKLFLQKKNITMQTFQILYNGTF